jgi:hypothetical protein
MSVLIIIPRMLMACRKVNFDVKRKKKGRVRWRRALGSLYCRPLSASCCPTAPMGAQRKLQMALLLDYFILFCTPDEEKDCRRNEHIALLSFKLPLFLEVYAIHGGGGKVVGFT